MSGYQGHLGLESSSALTQLPHLENEKMLSPLHSCFKSCVIHDLHTNTSFLSFFLPPPLLSLRYRMCFCRKNLWCEEKGERGCFHILFLNYAPDRLKITVSGLEEDFKVHWVSSEMCRFPL